jgi:hypothetical protein
MALRPFAKHPKRKVEDDDDTTPSAADEFAQFFSNDPRPDEPTADEAPSAPAEHSAPTVTMKEHSAAGWYPDSKDPGLMRYWDGFHLTGQTMRVDPARPPAASDSGEETAGVAASGPAPAPASSAADLLAPDRAKPPLLGSHLLPSAVDSTAEQESASDPVQPEPEDAHVDTPVAAGEVGQRPASPMAPTTPVASAAAAAPTTPIAPTTPAAPLAPASPDPSPSAPTFARIKTPVAEPVAPQPTANSWAERTEQAVARALALDTPEAWQEAAEAAAVVSEMALTMQVAADVRQSAEQLEEAAEEALRRAEEAEDLTAEAQRAVQKTAQAAREAAEAAEAASRAATEAKQKAERAAESMPRVAARSNEATQAAASAKRKAQLVEEIVTQAHRADTPEAWSEAHRNAQQAMNRDHREP